MATTPSDYQDYNISPFLLDYIHLQNHPMAIKLMEEQGNSNMIFNTNSIFSQFYPPEPPVVEAAPAPATSMAVHESSCLDHSSNETSVTVPRKQSSESSTVSQKQSPIDKKRKSRNGSSPNSAQSKDAREGRGKKQRQCNGQQKPKADKKDQKKTDGAANHQEQPPIGYIHVRARRGQATDSHSLAERVRREKISERMKILQRLVPGCDKVTGKALMLDEIINYVQSLQNQVEFLSLKLASVNPMFYDFSMGQDSFIFRPEEASPMLQCSPNQSTVFADTPPPPPPPAATTTTTTTTTPNNSYSLVDTCASLLLHQQSHRPSAFSQDNAGLLWDVEEQGQKFLNSSGFSDNLCSFN